MISFFRLFLILNLNGQAYGYNNKILTVITSYNEKNMFFWTFSRIMFKFVVNYVYMYKTSDNHLPYSKTRIGTFPFWYALWLFECFQAGKIYTVFENNIIKIFY